MAGSDHSSPVSPAVIQDLTALNARGPLTHCITNIVAAGFTANVLLAVGASPAMVIAPEEAGAFAAIADGLLINVGTVTSEQGDGMRAAVSAAADAGTPWVLDPVAIGGQLRYRTELVSELLEHRPAVIRGNASEILALAGAAEGPKGVESTVASSDAVASAQAVARRTGAVIAISGEVDFVTDGSKVVPVHGGHVLLTKLTGTGCALGGVIAALLAVSPTPLQAAVSASALFAAAGEQAAQTASAPGTYASALLDALYLISRNPAQSRGALAPPS